MAMGKNHVVGGANVNNVYVVILITVLIFYTFSYGIPFPMVVESQEQGKLNAFDDEKLYLKIDKISVGDSPTGLISVKGTVHNNSTENIINVKVKVELLNANNGLAAEAERFVTPASSIFKPGYESQFDFLVTARNVDHYNMTAYGDKAQ
jgi:hypothetical protein